MTETGTKVIALNYTLYRDNAEGELIESTEGKQPLAFLSGVGQMIPEFENNVVNLNAGDTFSFGIKADSAYGQRNEEIASFVGTATESVIRLLSEFKKDGFIELKGRRIKIIQANQLTIVGNVFD